MNARGFTDRAGLDDVARGRDRVGVVVNWLGQSASAMHVVGTHPADQPEWLPLSQVTVATGDLDAVRARFRAGGTAVLKIEIPRWLALEKHLLDVAGEGQGELW